MTVYVAQVDAAPNNKFQVAIYTDSNGRPGSRVVASASGTLTANSWNSLPVSAVLQAGQAYWLVYNSNGRGYTLNAMRYNPGPVGQGVYRSVGVSFGTWPSNFGAATLSTGVFSLYASGSDGATDTTPPTITSTSPVNGQTGVNTSTTVSVTFSEAINPSTLTTSTFVLRAGSTTLTSTVNYNGSTNVATLTPTAALAAGTTYSATITGGASGVKDIAGNPLANSYSWSFTTMPADTTPPTVTATSPSSEAGGVSTETTVTASFSEAINQATLTTATFVLRDPSSVAVNAVLSYDQSTFVATLSPAQPLAGASTYTATIVGGSSGVRDQAGNPLDGNTVWSFTTAASQQSVIGEWSPVMNWPLIAIHSSLLRTGKVLLWDDEAGTNATHPFVWDPATQSMLGTPVVPHELFCAGQISLSNGNILAAGGHLATGGEDGINTTYQYDPVANVWTRTADMAYRRWYPTVTNLYDGRVAIVSGQISSGVWADVPEVYTPSTGAITALTNIRTSEMQEEEYPAGFGLPDGKILAISSEHGGSQLLDADAGTWTPVERTPILFGSAVQYRPGKILMSGGGDGFGSTSRAATAVLDMSEATPTWRTVAPMFLSRYMHNLVMLPTGQVFAVGGSDVVSGQASTGPLSAEIWDPAAEWWTMVAPLAVPRMYHSTAVLLPDGRVLVAGGGHNGIAPNFPSAQVYSPAYLFNGPRPAISQAPDAIPYGSTIVIDSPDAANVSSISLIRLATATHSLDMSQFYRELAFTKTSDQLTITAPLDGREAPPGYYMLFLVNTQGVPSVAKILSVGSVAAPPPPPPPPPGQSTIGLTTIASNLDSGDSHSLNGSMVTTSSGGQITSMSAFVGNIDGAGYQQFQFAVYADSSGGPGTLIATSTSGTLIANAWNTLPINASLLPNTRYWFIYNTNGRNSTVNNMFYNVGGGQNAYSAPSVTFGNWPTTFPSPVLSNAAFSLFATFGP